MSLKLVLKLYPPHSFYLTQLGSSSVVPAGIEEWDNAAGLDAFAEMGSSMSPTLPASSMTSVLRSETSLVRNTYRY